MACDVRVIIDEQLHVALTRPSQGGFFVNRSFPFWAKSSIIEFGSADAGPKTVGGGTIMRISLIRVFIRFLILSAILSLVGCGGGTPTPGDPTAHLEAGRAHLQAGDFDKAVAEFEAAIQVDPALTEAHFRLGNAYAERGQLDKAAEEFQAVLSLDANYANAHSNLGVVYYQKGQLT